MFALFLLMMVGAWLLWSWLQESIVGRREAERLAHRTRLRRQILAHSPDSLAAYETLGDALRAEGDLTEAISVYEEALRRSKAGETGGAGWLAGAGLENKLRLTRLELSQERSPEEHEQTLSTRQQVCPICGALAMAQDRNCPTCGATLAVDSFFDTLRSTALRQSIVGETVQIVILLAIVTVALLIASWMPIEIRGAIAIAALIVIPMRLLKRLGRD